MLGVMPHSASTSRAKAKARSTFYRHIKPGAKLLLLPGTTEHDINCAMRHGISAADMLLVDKDEGNIDIAISKVKRGRKALDKAAKHTGWMSDAAQKWGEDGRIINAAFADLMGTATGFLGRRTVCNEVAGLLLSKAIEATKQRPFILGITILRGHDIGLQGLTKEEKQAARDRSVGWIVDNALDLRDSHVDGPPLQAHKLDEFSYQTDSPMKIYVYALTPQEAV
jgi:hypothetical protein